MNTVDKEGWERDEIHELVSVFERFRKAQKLDGFSQNEKEFVVMCASELIASMSVENRDA